MNNNCRECGRPDTGLLNPYKYISNNESMITRSTVMHTDNPDAYYIMKLLKSNPCEGGK